MAEESGSRHEIWLEEWERGGRGGGGIPGGAVIEGRRS